MDLFVGLSPGWESPESSCKGIVGNSSCTVNSTGVLEQGSPFLLGGAGVGLAFCDWLDTPARYSVAWKIAFRPA